jgi:hypothetical protein
MAIRELQGNNTNTTASRHSGAETKIYFFFFLDVGAVANLSRCDQRRGNEKEKKEEEGG